MEGRANYSVCELVEIEIHFYQMAVQGGRSLTRVPFANSDFLKSELNEFAK
jgi:hypothetical protein